MDVSVSIWVLFKQKPSGYQMDVLGVAAQHRPGGFWPSEKMNDDSLCSSYSGYSEVLLMYPVMVFQLGQALYLN